MGWEERNGALNSLRPTGALCCVGGCVCVCVVCGGVFIPRPGGSAAAIATFLSRVIVGFGWAGREEGWRLGRGGLLACFHDTAAVCYAEGIIERCLEYARPAFWKLWHFSRGHCCFRAGLVLGDCERRDGAESGWSIRWYVSANARQQRKIKTISVSWLAQPRFWAARSRDRTKKQDFSNPSLALLMGDGDLMNAFSFLSPRDAADGPS